MSLFPREGSILMSVEENKALVRCLYNLLNKKELDTAYEYFTPGFIWHSPAGDLSLTEMKRVDTEFYAAFPDMSVTIEEIVAEGDKVSVRVTYRGTHRGEFIGIAPTGNKINITNATTLRISGGKFVEGWNVMDIRLMQQLGAMPQR
jgi:predicted ester cyclase